MDTASWPPSALSEPKFALRSHQRQDLAFHIANPKSLNLSDPATGKTGTVCVLAYYHWVRHGRKTVWTMPKSLLQKNKDEFALFTNFDEDDIAILHTDHAALTKNWTGPTFERKRKVRVATGRKDPEGKEIFRTELVPEMAKDLIAAAKDAKVFICTFSFLSRHWKRLLETIPEIDNFMVDELHLGYGGIESQQTQSFYHVNRRCSQFVGMTGTLIDGRLDSVFPSIHAIEPNYYGSYNGFLAEHAGFIDDYGRVLEWKNEQKIAQILARHSVRHSFEEVYGDEPVHFETRMVPVKPKCRESYDKFHENAMLELENAEILDGTLPGVNVIRARQILAHPETMGLAKGETTGKDEVLAQYAVEGRPMLVFAALKPEQRRCLKVLQEAGLRAALINSDTPTPERVRIDRAFRAGELDAIVGSGPTVAVGYNWERADHVIFVSIDYKDVNILQAYRRASRGSRTSVLRVTYLQYEDSIDQRQYEIISNKSRMANKVDPSRKVLTI